MQKEYVWLKDKFVEKQKALIPIQTHGFVYGTSVFEGIRAYFNEEEKQLYIFRMKEHFERMKASENAMEMLSKYNVKDYCEITKKLLIKNNYKKNIYIRPTLFNNAQKLSLDVFDGENDFVIYTLNVTSDYTKYNSGFDVCISPYRRTSNNAIPSKAKIGGGYANSALILSEAKKRGFKEAIALSDEGYITEGSAMNFFIVKDKILITPCENDNILIGITRNSLLEIADYYGIKTCQKRIFPDDLKNIDEAFFCGTGAQICPVLSIDGKKINNGKIGEITKSLQKYYNNIVYAKIDKFKKWCYPVYD